MVNLNHNMRNLSIEKCAKDKSSRPEGPLTRSWGLEGPKTLSSLVKRFLFLFLAKWEMVLRLMISNQCCLYPEKQC